MCENWTLDPWIWRFQASFGVLHRLGGSLDIEDRLPNPVYLKDHHHNPDLEDFRESLALAEESNFDPKMTIAMASRGRRGGVPAHEVEQRREERVEPRREDQGEQQAPAPQGPVLPPPPPVDYGVFMQGLVQSMQTQAHTQAALQAQLEAQAPVPQEHDHGGPSIMEKFKRIAPPSFKRESDPLLGESWMREIERIFRAIRCAEEDKERADVWWSSLLRTRFEDGAVEVAWDEFVRIFRAKFVLEHVQDKME
ncbi:hypothetical protein Taro_002647 [Colocasia esculenta]|uniref:Gag protein n=1 Tax=Colocasia esculenta TaxID=4460 RepID=A0A843TM41_COLES|nr:hypothetical protein [Colocasia esculenta]